MIENFVLATFAILIAAMVYTAVCFLVLIVFLIKFTIQTLKELYVNSKSNR